MTETVQGRIPQEEIEEALKEVIDPELGVNIVDLGLLYGLRWDEDGTLILDLTLTTAACPLQEVGCRRGARSVLLRTAAI